MTGASAGIGVDLAECFAKDGYDLILAARTESALRQVADRLAATYASRRRRSPRIWQSIGGGARLADEIEQQRPLGGRRREQCRATAMAGAFDGSDAAAQLGMIDLNDRALVELTHIYWPAMLANKRGGVLNVASTAAFQPGPLMAIYYASKAFVLSFSEALWEEARGTGVKVSCLCPGPTVSKFRERAGTGKTRLSRSRHADAVDDRRAHGLRRVAEQQAGRGHRHAQSRHGVAGAVPAAHDACCASCGICSRRCSAGTSLPSPPIFRPGQAACRRVPASSPLPSPLTLIDRRN